MDRSADRTRPASGRSARALAIGAVALVVVLCGCSKSDDDSSATSTTKAPATTTATTPTTEAPPTTAGGAPKFLTFTASSPVPCQDGNATTHMAFTTQGVQDMAISVDGGPFAETAGYGPNETDVVASIPCSGAGSGTVQMKGCNVADECATSDEATVEITAS